MERPMHIGRLSAKLTPGVFVVEDLLIEGLTPSDRPFLKAKKIEVRLPWWTAFNRKLIIEAVTLTDWEMVVESWPGGRHSFPKVMPKNRGTGPSRFTTTLRSVLATRGQFTYDDHATPWSIVAREPDAAAPQERRHQRLSRHRDGSPNGTVKIQAYQPFRVDMQIAVQHQRRENALRPHGSHRATAPGPSVTGDVDLGRWPEQLYQLRSRIDFPTQKEHLLSRAEVRRLWRRRLHRHVSPVQGRARAEGLVRQCRSRRQRLAVSEPARIRALAAGSTRDHECHERALRRHGALRLPDGAVRPADDQRARSGMSNTGMSISPRLTDFLETEGLRLSGRASGRNRLEWPLGKWALKTGQRRGHDRAAAGRSADDARAAGRPRRRAQRAPG